jgi:hypothetical protein
VDIMAQQTHGIHGALPHEHDAIDAANRAAFEEGFRIIKRAWTEDLLAFDGRYWRVPAGETPWTLEATARFGAGVRDNIVRQVAVVPKPQKPHPPLPAVRVLRRSTAGAEEGARRFCAAAPEARTPPVRVVRRGLRPAAG